MATQLFTTTTSLYNQEPTTIRHTPSSTFLKELRKMRMSLTGREVLQTGPRLINFADDLPTTTDSTTQLPTNTVGYDTSLSYFDQMYTKLETLGSGSFGDVYKAVFKPSGKECAVKLLKRPFKGEADRKESLREVQRLQFLPNHPNVMQMLCAWEEMAQLYIAMELCETNLTEVSRRFNECQKCTGMQEANIWTLLIDMLKALDQLHSAGKIHMDVKPENILLTRREGPWLWKLADFGLLFDMKKDRVPEDISEIVGDGKYLDNGVLATGCISPAIDVYSLGMTVLEVAIGRTLSNGSHQLAQIRNGTMPVEQLKHISTYLVGRITEMLSVHPSARPTAGRLLDAVLIEKWVSKGTTTGSNHCKCQLENDTVDTDDLMVTDSDDEYSQLLLSHKAEFEQSKSARLSLTSRPRLSQQFSFNSVNSQNSQKKLFFDVSDDELPISTRSEPERKPFRQLFLSADTPTAGLEKTEKNLESNEKSDVAIQSVVQLLTTPVRRKNIRKLSLRSAVGSGKVDSYYCSVDQTPMFYFASPLGSSEPPSKKTAAEDKSRNSALLSVSGSNTEQDYQNHLLDHTPVSRNAGTRFKRLNKRSLKPSVVGEHLEEDENMMETCSSPDSGFEELLALPWNSTPRKTDEHAMPSSLLNDQSNSEDSVINTVTTPVTRKPRLAVRQTRGAQQGFLSPQPFQALNSYVLPVELCILEKTT